MDERILIVDDDVDMAEACRKIFRKAGIESDAVYGAQQALDALAREPRYTLVLTDLRMPRIDGTELLQRIKKDHPQIDVIMMTGYGTIQNAIQAMKIGATDYITKPFDKEELLRAVTRSSSRGVCRGRSARLRERTEGNLAVPEARRRRAGDAARSSR